ncbi:MAG: DUF1134 domain-containing protein [Rhodothalassiaceae bacterium]
MPRTIRQIFLAIFALGFLLAGCASTDSTKNDEIVVDKSKQTAENSYDQRTVLEAGKEVFGEGAEGLGEIIESIFADLGRPNAYITGEEAGGAFIAGLRYGDGVLHHKIEGEREVHWTGPSLGFDVGANGAKVFTLVYNLYDTEELYRRFPAVEGQFYFVGGLGVAYFKRGDVVIAPIRLGVGLRAGANAGYMKFTKKSTLNPF